MHKRNNSANGTGTVGLLFLAGIAGMSMLDAQGITHELSKQLRELARPETVAAIQNNTGSIEAIIGVGIITPILAIGIPSVRDGIGLYVKKAETAIAKAIRA